MRITSAIKRGIWQLLILIVLAALALNYQTILDQYTLATYHPTAAVAAIEPHLGLTDKGRALLYRANPQVDDKAAFNVNCQTSKGELELGCYYHDRIFVLQIENTDLAPEMDVVMAHELLHAAWARLSQSERDKLTPELEQVYTGLNDQDLRDRMAGYAKSEPGQESNELHSILGTEQAKLPADLETYYDQYFTNRSLITAAHAAYENVFSSRRMELEGELATIRNLKGQLAGLNARMASLRSAGEISQYNALVPQQNNLVDEINGRIDTYTRGVEEYNALSTSLDSQQITDTESSVQ